MVQGYYTLEEAARILGMGTEELSQMAQKREVRAFADRGTWRFRTQDIEELARRRGLGSNPDLPLGEAGRPKLHDSPTPKKKDPSGSDEGVFTFALGDSSDQVEIGQEIVSESGSSARAGSKSGSRSGPKSPPPKPGSDSDVRLVAEGSGVGHQIAPDSGVALSPDDSGTKPDSKKNLKKPDSGVRLAPDSDSDVKIVPDSTEATASKGGSPKSGTDSDIRLETGGPSSAQRGRQEDSYLTEEIDLDAELRAAEEAARAKKPPSAAKPTPATGAPGRDTPVRKDAATPDSSDFDLGIDSGSSIEIDSGDLKGKPEEVQLGEAPPRAAGASDSGINLREPADSGISLEQGGDSSEEIEFELSLDAESTPKPAKASPNVDSSSEFELTLEDSARLAPLEEEAKKAAGEDKDIFETDFEVPALEDESGSQVAALEDSDTDLESSDFDLALGEEDAAATEESGSQVVALEDEEEVDEGAATVARPRKGGAAVEEEEEAGDLVEEEELEEEEEVVLGRRPAVVAAPADWGLFAPITLCVSVVILFFVGMMSLELLHSMWGYRQPNKASAMMIKAFGSVMGIDAKDLDK